MHCAPWYFDPGFRATRNYRICIACSQSNPWNIFHSLAVNIFSCCHCLYFWKYFVNILYIFVNFVLWRLCVPGEIAAITRRRVGRPKLPGSLQSIRLRESVCNLWKDRKEALGFSERTDSEFAEFLLHRRRWGLLLDSYMVYTTCSASYINLFSCVADTRLRTAFVVNFFFSLLDQTPVVHPQR